MFIKFDQTLEDILCCPMCKGGLQKKDSGFGCRDCGLFFPLTSVEIGPAHIENVYDFRIHRPPYCIPQSKVLWLESQASYEKFTDEAKVRDSLSEYLDQIDSVREIYTEEYHISGSVLDVGGHQGRLRHFLGSDVNLYVSIDPHIEIFRGLDQRPNLLKAYPCLSEPCNFLSAHAEYLPFKSRSFDWVHMRSVVDHFEDPYKAFLEAYRVARIGSRLLVGLAILEKIKSKLEEDARISFNASLPVGQPEITASMETQASINPADSKSHISLPQRAYLKWKNEGGRELLRAVRRRISPQLNLPVQPEPIPTAAPELQIAQADSHDDHMYRFTYGDLLDLMEKTGWTVVKTHWQKPPYYYCIYAMGEVHLPKDKK